MINLQLLEYKKLKNNFLYSCFLITPLNSTLGITLGTLLKRILLNELVGTAITGVKVKNDMYFLKTTKKIFTNFNNPLYQISSKEDIFEILMNLKKIILKSEIINKTEAFINIKGPKIITGEDISLPNNVFIINPKAYIASMLNTENFSLELLIENGKGSKLSDEKIISNDYFVIDANFSPVNKVNFSIKLKEIEDVIKEELFIEIWTNGSISPKRAILESLKYISNIFINLFENLNISSILKK